MLNHQNIETNPQRISKINLYISKYNWEGIEFPAGPKDWEKLQQNNKTIALNISFVPYDTETIRVSYRSKYNHKRKNQVILSMITDGNKRYYIAVSSLSALLNVFRMREPYPQSHVTLRYRGHMTNKKRYISTFTRSMGPKLSRMVT